MQVHLRKRVLWFSCLAAMAIVSLFVGDLLEPNTKKLILIILIVVGAASMIVLLFIDRRRSDQQPMDDLGKVQRAMDAEEELRKR